MIITEEQVQHGVTDCGAIRSFSPPSDWLLGTCRQDPYGYVVSWHPRDNQNVSVNVSYQGHPLAEDQALALQRVLATEHTLTTDEIQSIRATLRDESRPDVFTISSAVVRSVSNIAVLEVAGSYLDQPVSTITIRINSSGDGRIVQEVSYRAPTEAYRQYLASALASLGSLQIS